MRNESIKRMNYLLGRDHLRISACISKLGDKVICFTKFLCQRAWCVFEEFFV